MTTNRTFRIPVSPRPARRPLRPLATAVLALVAGAVAVHVTAGRAVAQQQEREVAPDDAARRVAERLHRGLAAGDSARVLELLAPEARIYESGHAETRAEYRAGHLGIDIEFASGTERRVLSERVRAREGMAVYMAETRTTGTFRGEEVDSRGTETLVMERGPGGAWRVVHVHWSSR